MAEIVTIERRYIGQAEPDIIVLFQISQSTWDTLRRTEFWKEVEKFIEEAEEGVN